MRFLGLFDSNSEHSFWAMLDAPLENPQWTMTGSGIMSQVVHQLSECGAAWLAHLLWTRARECSAVTGDCDLCRGERPKAEVPKRSRGSKVQILPLRQNYLLNNISGLLAQPKETPMPSGSTQPLF